jgi:hypothetical protein
MTFGPFLRKTIVNSTDPGVPFGNINIVFFGDFMQYAPVLGKALFTDVFTQSESSVVNSTSQTKKTLNEYEIQYQVERALILHVLKSKIPVTGSCRKKPEFPGTGSSIPVRNCLDFFPVDSCQLPVRFDRNRLEIIGKSPENCRPEYCFHVPGNSGVFRPEPARSY